MFKGGVNAVEAAVHDLPEFKGGVNAVQALVNEVPEYTGGVNGVEPAVHEKPEYTGLLGTAGDEPAPTVEKPEYKLTPAPLADTKTSKIKDTLKNEESKKTLPETGEDQSDTALFLAGISLALSAALFAINSKKE